jgi:hypothetical protein
LALTRGPWREHRAAWQSGYETLGAPSAFADINSAAPTFRPGTFYAIHRPPAFKQGRQPLQPEFYPIDCVQYCVLGQSGSAPLLDAAVLTPATAAVLTLCW